MKPTLTEKQIRDFLKSRGISKNMTDAIIITLTQKAIEEGNSVQADRIYTFMALMLHEVYGFGAKRIIKGLEKYDEYCGRTPEEWDWPDIMKELREKTGLVIQSNSADRIVFEYIPEEMKK